MFTGLSSLRKTEKKEPTVQNAALQEYLKKYASDDGAGEVVEQKKKKKKKKPKAGSAGCGVAILDQDVSGFEQLPQTSAHLEPKRDPNEDDDDEPVIANAEEAEALQLQIEKVQQLLHDCMHD
eukprot:gene4179-4427_t